MTLWLRLWLSLRETPMSDAERLSAEPDPYDELRAPGPNKVMPGVWMPKERYDEIMGRVRELEAERDDLTAHLSTPEALRYEILRVALADHTEMRAVLRALCDACYKLPIEQRGPIVAELVAARRYLEQE